MLRISNSGRRKDSSAPQLQARKRCGQMRASAPVSIDLAATSLQGKRFGNEDCVKCVEIEGKHLAVVSDGIGGAPYGDVASHVAAGSFVDEILDGKTAQAAFEAASLAVAKLARWLNSPGTGATLAALLIEGTTAEVLWAGDSIALHWREGRLVHATRPMRSPDGSLGSCLGWEDGVVPAFETIALEAGDRLVLCTDGVWSSVSWEAIGTILSKGEGAFTTARYLALEGAESGGDNSTAAVFCVDERAGLE